MRLARFLIAVVLFGLLTSQCSRRKESCGDGKLNQNETLTDCGGVCAPCPTCSDGILNQDETSIDCGGSCTVCTSCNNGVQDQGEYGIDCGGPCSAKCPVIYPQNGSYGFNILSYDSLQPIKGAPANPSVQPSAYYSLRLELAESASARVKLINQSIQQANNWGLVNGTASGWTVGSYSGNAQEFSSAAKGPSDLKLYFRGQGAARVEFYEYGATTASRVKNIKWGP